MSHPLDSIFVWIIASILLSNIFPMTTEALRFYVPANDKKCLKEEIHKNVVLTGEYEISDAVGHTTTVHVFLLNYFFEFKPSF